MIRIFLRKVPKVGHNRSACRTRTYFGGQIPGGIREGEASVQLLLTPEIAEIGASDVEIVAKHGDVLSRMGYELDLFGATSVVIRGVPSQSAGGVPPAESLMAAIEGIVSAPSGSDPGLLADHIAVSLACRGAVKAGDSLTIAEMKSLVERLFESEDPYRCPHGRPVVVLVPGGDALARSFGRK